MASSVVGRFAPSPSGRMHLGNVMSALLCWLSARSAGGRLVLRIEDIDPERSRDEYARFIIEDLRFLGLDWDEGEGAGGAHGPYRQSGRTAVYEEALRRRFLDGLRGLPAIVYGEHDGHPHTGVVALNLAGLDSSAVADRLAYEHGVATRAGLHCAPRMHAALGTLDRGAVRFSFGWYTTAADVDAALEALDAIAREVA